MIVDKELNEITDEMLEEHFRVRDNQKELNHRLSNDKFHYLEMILEGIEIQKKKDAENIAKGLPVDEI
jgi:hypothetical protein